MEELDLKELFNLFWSKKGIIAIFILVFAIIGIVYSYYFVKPRYKSETSLLIVKEQTTTSTTSTSTDTLTTADLTLNQKLASTYSELVTSKTVLKKIINDLNLNMTEKQLKSSISVSLVKDSELIKITVTNADPVNAKVIATELVSAFIDQITETYKMDNVSIIDAAEVEKDPYNINHKKDVAIFAMIGLVLAAAYILVANMIDTTVKGKDDIETNAKLTVLTQIPTCNFNDELITRKGGRR